MKRPPALIAIVIYKSFTATLLAVTSIALFLTLKNYDDLSDFADEYSLVGKRELIKLILEQITDLEPKTLIFSAVAAAIYSFITAIEAVGLWYDKIWAAILVLVMVGISIPFEIYELIKGVSSVKLIAFILNIAVFVYLSYHESEKFKKKQINRE